MWTSLTGARSRRSGDEGIGRNRFGTPGRGARVLDRPPQSLKIFFRNDKNQSSAIEGHRIGEALFLSGRDLSSTLHGGAQLSASCGDHGGANYGNCAADDCAGGCSQEPSTTTNPVAAITDGTLDALQEQPPTLASVSVSSSGVAVTALPPRGEAAMA